MSIYILVHGAWLGAWCWDHVNALLVRAGHTVLAPDLPAHGADRTPVPEATLQSYTDRITGILAAQPEPVILVGHNLGGAVISQAAEAMPGRVQALIYLSAYLLQSGETVLQTVREDSESLLAPNIVVDEAQGVASIQPGAIPQALYNGCTPQDTMWAMGRMRPEPVAPLLTPVQISAASFGRLPRVYITTLRDHAIGPGLQHRMYTALPSHIVPLDAGHASFLSVPGAVAADLITAPQTVAVGT